MQSNLRHQKAEKKNINKILKMDENNQYGNPMTKPLPYSCIKKPLKCLLFWSLRKYLIVYLTRTKSVIFLLLTLNFTIKTKMLFNEIYMPNFDKNKVIQAQHRSVLQLMSVISRNKEKDLVRTFKANSKTHSTLEEKTLSLFMQNTFTF